MKVEHPRLKQALAAEYVLGTLAGRARRRFERLLGVRADLRDEVRWWERRLAPLQHGFTPQTPRAVVWAAIEKQINAQTVTALPPPAGAAAPRGLRLWQAWALTATAASVVLAIGLARELNRPPPPAQLVRVEVPVFQPLPYVALLRPGESEVQWLVTLSPERRLIRITGSGKFPLDFSRESLELWVVGDDGTPRSLGVMPDDGDGEMPMPRGLTMPAKPTLAVSREPAGGSPTGLPTGPVITVSPALRAS
ncbi:anti-sigma factor [Sinimarinibacterium sp. HSW-8]|uniref:Anti-sigma factor n=2 Tax=Sinimarinibacterium thermocellulolyticum TaxID=3170016 RepID=A0ABV2AEN8_9GAMM